MAKTEGIFDMNKLYKLIFSLHIYSLFINEAFDTYLLYFRQLFFYLLEHHYVLVFSCCRVFILLFHNVMHTLLIIALLLTAYYENKALIVSDLSYSSTTNITLLVIFHWMVGILYYSRVCVITGRYNVFSYSHL